MNHKTPVWVWGLVLAGAIALPLFLHARDMDFYVSMLSRMMIYGIAACSLNLILGFGGMVSFGHAAFVGVGAYAMVALFEVGALTTSMQVIRNEEVLYDRDQAFGGAQLTQLIVLQYGFSHEEAEIKKCKGEPSSHH